MLRQTHREFPPESACRMSTMKDISDAEEKLHRLLDAIKNASSSDFVRLTTQLEDTLAEHAEAIRGLKLLNLKWSHFRLLG